MEPELVHHPMYRLPPACPQPVFTHGEKIIVAVARSCLLWFVVTGRGFAGAQRYAPWLCA